MGNVFEDLLVSPGTILTEGSVYEVLRRDEEIVFDSAIAHAGLVYDGRFRERLAEVHRGYFSIARRAGLPLVALTDTWRASAERIESSSFADRPVNEDNVRFMRELYGSDEAGGSPVVVAGLTGPKGDAYRPTEAPGREEARLYHAPQVLALAAAGVDLLRAATLPSVDEALGIADAMAETALPYLLSFVVRSDGLVLDGTALADAIRRLDDETGRPPLGFAVNCVHPSVFASTMSVLETAHPDLVERVVWLQANTSAWSPEELDGREILDQGKPADYAEQLAGAGRDFGLRVLGGCCGSDTRHMAELARRVRRDRAGAAGDSRGERSTQEVEGEPG